LVGLKQKPGLILSGQPGFRNIPLRLA
jgi:hypothetical protein